MKSWSFAMFFFFLQKKLSARAILNSVKTKEHNAVVNFIYLRRKT